MEEDKKKSEKTEHGMRWYISLAVLVFVLFCCCTMFFFMIYRYNGVSKGWDTIMKVLQPITFGLAGVTGMDYQLLIEADFLVNAFEDGLPEENIRNVRANLFKSEAGKKLLDEIFAL